MSIPIQIWVEASHNPAFRCGGWAWVRREGETLAGVAGGERSVSAQRTALTALATALKGLPAGASVETRTADATIQQAWRRFAELRAGGDPPDDDLDLWAQLQAAAEGRSIRLLAAAGAPDAFAKAWAELARDKAKAAGGFAAPIPKANLAKAGA